MIDNKKLEKLERLAKAATPGPWKDKSFKRNYDWGVICSGGKRIAQCASADVTDEIKRVTFEEKLANAAYIAAACNAVPELITENRALQKQMREMERQRDWLAQKCEELSDDPEDFFMPYNTPTKEWIDRAEQAAKEAGND